MLRILIVEDEAHILRIMSLWLARNGYEILEAEDGAVALDEFQGWRPDLVLTDIYMPEMDGIEFIIHLQNLSPEVKVVAMSAGGSVTKHSLLKDARLLGAVDVIAKPFSDTELMDLLERVLNEPPRV